MTPVIETIGVDVCKCPPRQHFNFGETVVAVVNYEHDARNAICSLVTKCITRSCDYATTYAVGQLCAAPQIASLHLRGVHFIASERPSACAQILLVVASYSMFGFHVGFSRLTLCAATIAYFIFCLWLHLWFPQVAYRKVRICN